MPRIGDATEPTMKILLDDPETKARVAAIDAMPGPSNGGSLRNPAESAAVKPICSGS
jgi:hypothetical protein